MIKNMLGYDGPQIMISGGHGAPVVMVMTRFDDGR